MQKKRRADFLEQWRQYRNTVVRLADVEMQDKARGMRRGVYVGADGDRPTRSMDALVHKIDPGAASTVHRHSWDAMLFVVAGWGWTQIDGERVEWPVAIHIAAHTSAPPPPSLEEEPLTCTFAVVGAGCEPATSWL